MATIKGTTRDPRALADAIRWGANFRTSGALWGLAGSGGAYTIGSYARVLYSRKAGEALFTFHPAARGSVTTSRHLTLATRAIGADNIKRPEAA